MNLHTYIFIDLYKVTDNKNLYKKFSISLGKLSYFKNIWKLREQNPKQNRLHIERILFIFEEKHLTKFI
ncbi:hypothetical protein SY27_02465 [Flavobacterium sp. 316]|nr:hypothetical protein SY27_02465 [Flavobacterium sp. 316]